MRTLIALTFALSFNYSLAAKTFNLNVTLSQKDHCSAEKICLPKALSSTQKVQILDPQAQSFSQVDTVIKNYLVVFTLTKRSGKGGYYSFQIEVSDVITGQPIALCSRYEAIDSFETSLVGACMGQTRNFNGMVGVSLSLPN